MYTGAEADNAEFNEMYFNKSFSPLGYKGSGVEIDEIVSSTINKLVA